MIGRSQIKKLFPPAAETEPQPLSGWERQLAFLNTLPLGVRLRSVAAAGAHPASALPGWRGLAALTCRDAQGGTVDVDVRYADGPQIRTQQLVDHGWAVVEGRPAPDAPRRKLIVYLCAPTAGVERIEPPVTVPARFTIGGYWRTVQHLYLPLPDDVPFAVPLPTAPTGWATTARLSPTGTALPEMTGKLAHHVLLPAHPLRQGEGGLRTQGLFKQHSASEPLVSVITVVFNGAEQLEQTIQSVIGQSYRNVEYIIIDGGSRDATPDLIGRYAARIDYWVSEPDRGIADAWNKGLRAASGQIIALLNAGDVYAPDAVATIVARLDPARAQVSYGETRLVGADQRIARVVAGRFNPRRLQHGIGFLHPSCFATRAAYEQIGLFSTSYRLAMDCDWLLRCHLAGVPLIRLGNICYMRDDGVSNRSRYAAFGEYLQALSNNGYGELRVRLAMAQFGLSALARQLGKQLLARRGGV